MGGGENLDDYDRVLGHREGIVAGGLAVPARHPRQAMGDVGDLDIELRRIEQVEPAAR
jgi:hypothetical protein